MTNESNSNVTPKKRSRGKWPFIIIGGIVLFVIIGWSVFWIFISNQVERMVDGTIAEFSKQGPAPKCENISIGGYPFRLSVECESLSVVAENQTLVTAKELRGVALIYNPTHLIFEVDSPLSLNPGISTVPTINADWDLVQASLDFSDFDFSFVIDTANISIGNETELLSMGKFEAHGRFQDTPDVKGIDFNLKVRDFLPNTNAIDIEIPGAIDVGVHIPVEENFLRGPGQNVFAKFVDQGGEVHLNQARIAIAEVEVDISGKVKISDEGYLSGNLGLWLAGTDKLIQIIQRYAPSEISQIVGVLPTVISGFPPKEKNGVAGVEIPVRINNGAVRIGIFPLGVIPPLPPELMLQGETHIQ